MEEKGIRFSKIIKTVEAIPLFSVLDPSETEALVKNSRVSEFSVGEDVYEPQNIILILKGSVAVIKQTGDKKLLMRTLSDGGVSGVASLFSEDSASVSSLIAQRSTEALYINQDTVSELLKNNGEFAMKYVEFLTSRIRFLNSRIKSYTSGSAEAKLAYHLMMSYESVSGEVKLSVSMSKLAEILDIGRASLYRAIEDLTRKGVIRKSERKIEITDNEKLRMIANGVIDKTNFD